MEEQSLRSRRRFLQIVLGLLGLATVVPLRRVFARALQTPPAPPIPPPPAPPPVTDGAHLVVVTVMDGAKRTWFAQARVGDDPQVAAKYVKLVNAGGVEHAGLTAWFYADCVEVGVTRIDCPYDYLNCRLSVTYDGVDMPHAPSSKTDGTVDFWLGCRMPPVRYGTQVGWDASKIDRSLFPSYAWGESQKPYVDGALADYTFNGLGTATTFGMGAGGERADIGYMPQWNVGFLLNPSDKTWAIVRRADDHCGKWRAVYFSEPDTGSILDRTKVPPLTCFVAQAQVHTYATNALVPYLGSMDGDTLILPERTAAGHAKVTSACPNVPNGAHLTAYALLSAMITGTARDRDHASFWCNFPLFEMNPLKTVRSGLTAWVPRQFAWGIRNIFLGAYVSAHTAYFETELNHELQITNQRILGNNEYGIWDVYVTYPGVKGTAAEGWMGTATWQQFYISMTLDAIAHKRPEWVPLAKYLAGLPMMFFTKPYALLGACSQVFIKAPAGQSVGDWDAILARSISSYYRYTDAEAQAMVNVTSTQDAYNIARAMYARTGVKWIGKYENGVSDLQGNPLSVDAHTVDFTAAVVAAYNVGAAGSDKALRYVENLPTKPNFNTNQKYHLVPRSPVKPTNDHAHTSTTASSAVASEV